MNKWKLAQEDDDDLESEALDQPRKLPAIGTCTSARPLVVTRTAFNGPTGATTLTGKPPSRPQSRTMTHDLPLAGGYASRARTTRATSAPPKPSESTRPPIATPALGLFIAALATPHAEGTGGLSFAEDGDNKKVLLVTARRDLFLPNEVPIVNSTPTNTSLPRCDVLLLGTKAFDNLVESIKITIKGHGVIAELYNQLIEELQEREPGEDKFDVERATEERKKYQMLNEVNEVMVALDKFHDEVEPTEPTRHRAHCPLPSITLGAGTEGFTEDYAIIELDSSKIETAFRGNVIDLGMF